MNKSQDAPTQEQMNTFFSETAKYWQDIYESEDMQLALYVVRQKMTIEWVEEIAFNADFHVLEIGCGSGMLSVALAARGLCVHATDPVERMRELVWQNATAYGVTDHLTVGDGNIYALDEEDASYDLVIALGVFPCLDRPEAALWEMARVTRPGGYVIFSHQNKLALVCLLDPVRNAFIRPLLLFLETALPRVGIRLPRVIARDGNVWPELIAYSPRSADKILARSPFTKVKGSTLGFYPFTFLNHRFLSSSSAFRLARLLQRLVDRRIPVIRAMGENYLVLAKREDASNGNSEVNRPAGRRDR